MSINTPVKKRRWWSKECDSSADEFDNDGGNAGFSLQEVKHLRRVVRRGEKALRHRSEALQAEEVTEREIEITHEVLRGISSPRVIPPARSATAEIATFSCFECGAKIPLGSARCPECGVLYIGDPKGEVIDEVPSAREARTIDAEHVDIFKRESVAFVHFDMTTGVVTCLQKDGDESDWGLECDNCGTVTQFLTDRCPLCGHSFDEGDTGLVGLLTGLKFDLDGDKELDCPSCGQHVVVEAGRCPACKEIIGYKNDRAPDAAVLSILKDKDVIFVHLDVQNDAIWFARKVKFRKRKEDETIHLEVVTKDSFDREWKSLARI
jgi:rubrerythrin